MVQWAFEAVRRRAAAMSAKPVSIDRSHSDTVKRHRARFIALAAIFVAVQALIVGLSWAAIEAVDVARAYVAAEARYSKIQKAAVLHLHRFAESGDLEHFGNFEASLAVVDGARAARQALEHAPAPDFAAAREGFVQVGLDRADIDAMSTAFVLFKDWGPVAEAVAEWREGDRLMAELTARAREIRARIVAHASREDVADVMADVDILDRYLTSRESAFTAHMSESAGRIRDTALALLILGSIVLVAFGLFATWRISRKGAQTEFRARASERRFQEFTDVASDWFCELDGELNVVYLSDRFQESNGVDAAGVIGRDWREVVARPWLKVQTASHLPHLEQRLPFRGHVMRHLTPDGTERFWSLSGRPVFESGRRFAGYRVTGAEISELVRTNNELLRAKHLAEQASRSKSAFLANMSHELRTPLNAIIGFSETIKGEMFGPLENARYLEYAEDICSSGLHLLSLINDVLDLSRIEAGKLKLDNQRVFLSEIVDTTLSLCRERAARAGVRVDVVLPQPSPALTCDPLRLKQILINLASNAIKFTPANGCVEIAATLMPTGALAVSVKDTGIGMTSDGIAVALKPFGQVDNGLARKYEGTGLGLPLSKTLVELHGGSFLIESELNRGTTVTFTLPPERVQPQSATIASALERLSA